MAYFKRGFPKEDGEHSYEFRDVSNVNHLYEQQREEHFYRETRNKPIVIDANFVPEISFGFYEDGKLMYCALINDGCGNQVVFSGTFKSMLYSFETLDDLVKALEETIEKKSLLKKKIVAKGLIPINTPPSFNPNLKGKKPDKLAENDFDYVSKEVNSLISRFINH